jgi:hypothetical protein
MGNGIDRKWKWAGLAVGLVACALVGAAFLIVSRAPVGFYDYNFDVFADGSPLSNQQRQSLQALFKAFVWQPVVPMAVAVFLLLGFLSVLLFRHRK